ncbi:Proton-gated ion channel subunit pbo-5 [Caenorhabditis elegans]|uniref:Proton-gated ion channel subunit pbo-5 n=1 Tax=Caenorhabditis elegans TaxID=6239 RepID=PBO5_CAEEL|nr:Proton-gated ion channel subunit pbo-5 [Caenorhabditis elegans]G5ECT0.1 RecName: Full=Proton-gated ion channel subunit pbo-5; AltName: Full=PBoc defective protein pbo-5; Flags: Precursor [Caenorhabditis elegans]CAH19091.1 Proton-gated ion channel subunit pbo-5 [Caenorhabditis elegans]|eukprot:NP_001024240.1 Proton-gated ion channel subunit pbo-5 [Caenorhabditis elegans]
MTRLSILQHLLTFLILSKINATSTTESYFDSSEEAPNVLLNHLNNESEGEELTQINDTQPAFVPGSSKRLTEYLLSRHNLNAPPDGLLYVEYELELVHILGIDELKQTMTVLIYVDEHWVDPSLTWDPALFGGITKTWIPLDKIWVPDIIVFNMVKSNRLAHEDLLSAVRAPARIHYNGTIVASHPAVHTVSCEINIRHFPLDDQRCAIEIASWAYGQEKIRLHAHTDHSLEHYKRNEEWHLLNLNVSEEKYEHEGVEVSEVKFEISLKRRPLFYMVTLTFPSYIMCAISVVGLFARFSTTGEREERFTLGVTAILTMAVLSLVVSEKVPHSSTHVPLLVAYFLFNMVIVSIAAMTTGIVMKVHRLGRYGDEPSDFWMRCFLLKPVFRTSNRRKYRMNPEEPTQVILVSEAKNGEVLTKKSTELNGTVVKEIMLSSRLEALEEYIRKMVNRCETIKWELDEIDAAENIELVRRRSTNGYVRISERLDILFMFLFLSTVTIPVAVLFYLT